MYGSSGKERSAIKKEPPINEMMIDVLYDSKQNVYEFGVLCPTQIH